MKLVYGVLVITGLCIWMYLLNQVLIMVQATELMWFLFYCYIPVSLICVFLSEQIKKEIDKK